MSASSARSSKHSKKHRITQNLTGFAPSVFIMVPFWAHSSVDYFGSGQWVHELGKAFIMFGA